MVLALWDIDTETDEGRYRRDLSDATCTALQIANHWQDVRRDFLDSDRIYLPQEDIRRFGLSEEEIADGIRRKQCPDDFRTMMRFQVDRAEVWFRKGERLIDEVPRELAIDLRLFTDGGRAVLKAIERQDYDTLTRRPRVGKSTRAWLALRAAAQLKLTLTPPCNDDSIPQVADAYRECQAFTRRRATNFYIAFSALPREQAAGDLRGLRLRRDGRRRRRRRRHAGRTGGCAGSGARVAPCRLQRRRC